MHSPKGLDQFPLGTQRKRELHLRPLVQRWAYYAPLTFRNVERLAIPEMKVMVG